MKHTGFATIFLAAAVAVGYAWTRESSQAPIRVEELAVTEVASNPPACPAGGCTIAADPCAPSYPAPRTVSAEPPTSPQPTLAPPEPVQLPPIGQVVVIGLEVEQTASRTHRAPE